jgi:hypothetical protein
LPVTLSYFEPQVEDEELNYEHFEYWYISADHRTDSAGDDQ